MQASEPSRPRRRWWRKRRVWILAAILTPPALFTFNGLVLARGQTPTGSNGTLRRPIGTAETNLTVKVLAWNLAKCFLHHDVASFESKRIVRDRLRAMADVIRKERPDLVFLSEIVTECTLCDVDQVQFLREQTGFGAWAFGENYNLGLPFFRIVGGNAILSRYPLEALSNPDLAGRRPFYVSLNNRRVLLAHAVIHDQTILLGSIHTDSFDLENNLRQTEQILELCKGETTLLAGDFNAAPETASIAAIVASEQFTGAVHGPATFPSYAPLRRIDYVFGPRSWELLEHRVLNDETSDHCPIVSVFRVKKSGK